MSCYPSVLAPSLRPLEALLDDPAVTAIHINGPDQVWVRQHGVLQRSDVELSAAKVRALAGALGRAMGVTEDTASYGRRFAEGLAAQVVASPLAVDGPVISLTKPPPGPLTAEDLLADGCLSEELISLLTEAVEGRRGVLIVGTDPQVTSSFLVAVASLLPETERVVMIETGDVHPPDHPQLLRLRANEPEGAERLALLRAAIKLSPDRLILDGLGGAEAAELLLHGMGCLAGSLVAMGAPSAELGLFRLAALASTVGGVGGDPAALVAGAFGLVVHCASAGVGAPAALQAARIEPSGPGGGPVLQVVYRGTGVIGAVGASSVHSHLARSSGEVAPPVQAAPPSMPAPRAEAPSAAVESAAPPPSPPRPVPAVPEATVAAGIPAINEETEETVEDVEAAVAPVEATGMAIPRVIVSAPAPEPETTSRVSPVQESPPVPASAAFEEATNIVRFSAEQLDHLEHTDD